MTDPVDRAVDASIDAYRPASVPPFEAVEARKRTRDRRRGAGAALLSAAAVIAVAVLSGGAVLAPPDRQPTAAGSGAPQARTAVPDGYSAELRDAAWIAESVSEDRRSVDVLVAGGGCEAYADQEVRDDGDVLRLTVRNRVLVPLDDVHGCARSFVTTPVRIALPRALPPGDKLYGGCDDPGSGADPEACRGLDGGDSETATAPVWTGATICTGSGDDGCRRVGPQDAARLQTVLDTAVPSPPGAVYCQVRGTAYSIRFEHPRVRSVPVVVRTPCGPMEQGSALFDLDPVGQQRVETAYLNAGPGESVVAGLGAAFGGVLRAAEGGDCARLVTAAGLKVAVQWPAGYTVTYRPLVVRDQAGAVAAIEGDVVRFGYEGQEAAGAGSDVCGPHDGTAELTSPLVIDRG